MNKAQRDQLRTLATAASQGPWRYQVIRDVRIDAEVHHHCVMPHLANGNVLALTGPEHEPQGGHDARFIAAANPAIVLQLLDQVEQLDRALDETMKESDQHREMCDALAGGIGQHFNEYIGEHSNANCPWNAALQVLDLKPEFTHCACGTATAKVAGQ